MEDSTTIQREWIALQWTAQLSTTLPRPRWRLLRLSGCLRSRHPARARLFYSVAKDAATVQS
jgi:hypothetical protein